MGHEKSRDIYIGGFNKKFFVDEMSADHLINTISFIETKMDNIKTAGKRSGKTLSGNIKKVLKCLQKDQAMLLAELNSRDLCEGEC